jgi:glucose/arabinose dehydrogenase
LQQILEFPAMSGTIYFGATEYSVNERESFVTITIKRDGDLSKAASVDYGVNADTATAGLDYSPSNGRAEFGIGQSSITVQIPILDDASFEATERFNVSLINATDGYAVGIPRTTNVAILDDENPIVEPNNPPQTTDYDVTTTDAVTGLSGPMQIEWLPGGNRALVSEKEGRIKIVDFDTGRVVSTLLDITAKVNADADRGLLDIALHPDLDNNPYLYAFYVVDPPDVTASGLSAADREGNRYAHLVRYELDLSGAEPVVKPGTETVLLGGAGTSLADISGGGALDFTDQRHSGERASDMNADGTYKQDYIKVDSRSHAGGAIAFGPDGALYVSTGDGTSYNYADPRTASVQNVDSLSGKILRIDPISGEGYADNPYATSDLDANASKVWQTGLRNPYAMTFTEDGRVMISETGWYSWEEINSGGKGANYGWPYYEGADNGEINKTPGYQTMPGASAFYAKVASGEIVITPAFRAFSHTASDPGYHMQAIVGGTSVYDGDKYPEIFKGDYFFSDIVDGDIFTVDVNDRTQMQYVTNIGTYHAVSFVQGPDGYVYYSDITGNKIVRIDISDPNDVPNRAPSLANPIADASGSVGAALSIAIPAIAFSDPDNDQLVLSASLADGQPLPSWLSFNAATRVLSGTPPTGATGPIEIRITATDPDGLSADDNFVLTIGGTPANGTPVVATPLADQNGTAGSAWSYTLPAGTFTDPDADDLTLTATLANGQALPSWVTFNAQTGSFTGTPPAGAGNFTFRVTATDPKGAQVGDDFVLTVGSASTEAIVRDVASQNQFVTGSTANDVFVYAGNSSLYQWGPNQDGTGVVVWTRSTSDNTFDVLTGFEKLRFADKTVSLVEETGPDYLDVADQIQHLTGKTNADRFIINGKSTDYAWGPTASGDGIVIWTLSQSDDTYDILDDFDQLVFTDRTVYLTGAPPVNVAPVLATPIADQTGNRGTEFSFAVPAGAFTDANGDTLTYSARLSDGSALPSWLTLDATTGLFSGMPTGASNLSIVVTASDGRGGTANDTFVLNIAGNTPPVLNTPLVDRVVNDDTAMVIALPADAFTDADGDKLSYQVTLANGDPLPGWLVYDPITGTINGLPTSTSRDVSIRVTALDGKGGSVSDTFELKVNNINDNPELTKPLEDVSVQAGEALAFAIPSLTFYDPDLDVLTYSARLADGSALPSWISVNASNGSLTSTETVAGVYDIVITATDKGGLSASDTLRLTVNAAVNNMPTLELPVTDQTAESGDGYAFMLPTGMFKDQEDGTSLTYAVTLVDGQPLPAWLTFDAATRTLSGTPPETYSGKLDVKIVATDTGGLSASDSFALTVTNTNDAPVLVKPLPDATVQAPGYLFSYELPADAFSDADGDTLTYSAKLADGSDLPSWLSIDAVTGRLSGLPPQFDTLSIVVTASDGKGGSASDRFELSMRPNSAPVVTVPVADQSFQPGQAFSISLAENFSDPDNDPMLFFVTLADGSPLPDWIVVSNNGRTLSGIAPTVAQDMTIRVTVNDRNGGGTSDEFAFSVGSVNQAPVVATPIADQDIGSAVAFSFVLPATSFTDADGDALSYSVALASGAALPSWLSFDAATRTFTGTPGTAEAGKTYAIAVTASDGKGGSVTDTFDIAIEQLDLPPTLAKSIADQAGLAGDAFAFVVPMDTFADDNIVSYTATLVDGSDLPAWLSFDGTTRSFSGTLPANQPGSYEIKVEAKDASGGTASDVFKLTVGAQPAQTLYQNTASNQHIDAGEGTDVFVLGGNSANYSWGPTEDGKGVVIWNSQGFDILFNFEELRFTNKSVSVTTILGTGAPDVLDDSDATQHLVGKSENDRFIIDGQSADYGWGETQDGKGVVVWDRSGQDPHDILTGFETLVFEDREVEIGGIGTV